MRFPFAFLNRYRHRPQLWHQPKRYVLQLRSLPAANSAPASQQDDLKIVSMCGQRRWEVGLHGLPTPATDNVLEYLIFTDGHYHFLVPTDSNNIVNAVFESSLNVTRKRAQVIISIGTKPVLNCIEWNLNVVGLIYWVTQCFFLLMVLKI